MKKIMLRNLMFFITAIASVLILLIVVNLTTNNKAEPVSEAYLEGEESSEVQNKAQDNIKAKFEATILDTGKSDCILISIDDKAIMIDTGEDKNGEQIVSTLKEKGIDTLDYLILTHLDKDHIGGVDKVLSSVKVNNIVQANYKKDSKQYNEYINKIKEVGIEPILLKETLNITINNAEISIQPSEKSEYETSNEYSIITSVNYGKDKFLFAGDAEEERLSEFISKNAIKYNFVKIPHHGRYDKLSEEFLKSIAPTYAVITCSDKKMADEKVLKILNELNVKTYFTLNGNVVVKSNGTHINVSQ